VVVLPDLARRVRVPELMDDPTLDATRHACALDALARVNGLSGTARRVWREVRTLGRGGVRPVRVLDVACGDGHVLTEVGRRARRDGIDVDLCGCDLSPAALERARTRAGGEDVARFVQVDALRDELPGRHDVTTCSLFLHHLSEVEACRLLRAMAGAAERLLLVQDLRRTRTGYALAAVALRLITTSDVARHDGLVSVRAAFTLSEARSLVDSAGLAGADVRPCWPQRFTIRWARS
jgi:SAM-dependent methyltransferase